jgi:hypothetical protein
MHFAVFLEIIKCMAATGTEERYTALICIIYAFLTHKIGSCGP